MQKIPAFKYLLFLLFGLSFGLIVHIDETAAFIIIGISLLLVIISNYKTTWKKLYPIYPFIIGMVLIQNVESGKIIYPDKYIPEFNATVKGEIIKIVSIQPKSIRLLIKGQLNSTILKKNKDLVLLQTIYGRGFEELNLEVGDRIQAAIKVRTPAKPLFPNSFDEQTYAYSQSFHFYSSAHASNIGIIERASCFTAVLNSFKKTISTRISILFSVENSGIINALLTGDKSFINKETRNDFIITGTSHVLAVSGLHVGIISSVILLFISFFRTRLIRFLLFVLLLVSFVLLTGMQPSSIRAGVMAVLIYFAWLHQRNINLLNILSFAVICILLLDTSLIYSVGFQMSVAAILGISILLSKLLSFSTMLFGPSVGLKKYILTSMSLTISVSIVVSPLVAYYFKSFSIVSPIANLFVVPLITLAMFFSLISLVLSFISLPLAVIYASLADAVLDLMRGINSIASSLPFAAIKSETVLVVSIMVSISLIYIILSNSQKMLSFRLIISVCVIVISQFLIAENNNSEIEIIPSQDMVVITVPGTTKQLNILLDRKPHIRPRLDYSLFIHYKDSHRNDDFFINGNCGIMLTEELIRTKTIKTRYISLNNLTAIFGLLGINNNIFQTI